MSKCLVVPDVHLKPEMFARAKEIMLSGQADRAVVLGDLVDDWERQFDIDAYHKTMRAAVEFHDTFPNTLWCMGNHDMGYFYPGFGRKESGHSILAERAMTDWTTVLKDKGMEFACYYIVDNVIFSHAGVTQDWVDYMDKKADPDSKASSPKPDDLWREDSPIWARPQNSKMKMYKSGELFQVVGHTPTVTVIELKDFLSCDVFSTYPDGSPIGEERFVIIDTKTKKWEYAKEDGRDES